MAMAKIEGTGTTAELVAAVAGKRVYVNKIVLLISAATTIKFQAGTTDLTGAMPFDANSGFKSDAFQMAGERIYAIPYSPNQSENLNVDFGASVTYGGWIEYFLGS